MTSNMESECLFSFEMFVKNIDYLTVECNIPAVAFRLLDYPTIITYFTALENIRQMKNRINDNERAEEENELIKLRNEAGGYDFQKGKSCLFQHNFESFYKLVKRVPLYIMILDAWTDAPNLLGSFSLPLLELTKQLNSTISQNGQHCPAVGHHTGTYKVYNLMGTCVGKLSLELKLTCYGGSLLRHINTGSKREECVNVLLDLKFDDCRKSMFAEELTTDHVILPADGQLINTPKKDLKKCLEDKAVQCKSDRKLRGIKRNTALVSNIGDMLSSDDDTCNNVICPPPLFMNLKKDFRKPSLVNKVNKAVQRHHKAYLLESKLHSSVCSDEKPEVEVLKPIPGKKSCYTITRTKTKDEEIHSEKVESKRSVDEEGTKTSSTDMENLPVLCSLLQEISKLTNVLNKKTILQEKGEKTVATQTKKHTDQKRQKDKFLHSHELSHLRMERLAGSKKCIKASMKKPKRKENNKKQLSYGFTRTQMLRYKLTHDNVTTKNQFEEKEDASESEPKGFEDKKNLENYEIDESSHVQQEINSSGDQGILNRANTDPIIDSCLTSVTRHHSDIADSTCNEETVMRRTGFYSPTEPRSVSVSQLGIFDDRSPWSSISRDKNYDDDSFQSDASTISVTSSISIPQVISDHSTQNDGSRPVSRVSSPDHSTQNDGSRPVSRVFSSDHSAQKDGSRPVLRVFSSEYSAQKDGSRPVSRVSSSPRKLPSSVSRGSRITSRTTASSKSSPRTNQSTDNRCTSRSNSVENDDDRTSSTEDKNGTNVPVKSSQSPVKSRHRRSNKVDEKIININVPSLSTSNLNSTESIF